MFTKEARTADICSTQMHKAMNTLAAHNDKWHMTHQAALHGKGHASPLNVFPAGLANSIFTPYACSQSRQHS
jgi:hypothetical protein